MTYEKFLESKGQANCGSGFEPIWVPDWLFPFQKHLVEWAIRRGRCAVFAQCGLGKTAMQLVWASNIVQKTNRPVLVLTPLAVTSQTCLEADRFGIEATRSTDGKITSNIVVTNYERLHYFNPDDFAGVVCDESSILKSFSGTRRKQITRFMAKMPYRSLWTATPAPNDYIELGTSSEALGELSHSDMLRMFFAYIDDKGQKKEQKIQDFSEQIIDDDPSYYQKLSYRVAQTIGQWRLKYHAVIPFWRWVASWSRACRMPSDLGFDDADFVLPPFEEKDHIIEAGPPDGMLFNVPAIGMAGERDERRRTLRERCEYVADLVNHDRPAVVWCHLNPEGKQLAKVIPDAEEIAGSTPDDRKCELYEAFASGSLRVLVIKPKIGAWGLNWQFCNHIVTFPTHSYEQYHQLIGRCWRFGQKQMVHLDMVATDGEIRVLGNMRRKAIKADAMFASTVREMNSATSLETLNPYTDPVRLPAWLS